MLPYDMREWLSWWSTTLPRSGSRVRVPSRALNEAKTFSYEGFRFFLVSKGRIAGNDAFFWEGNHDLYRMFDHSVIAYDVERALTVSSPYSIALEDQLRYMAVDVNAEEGVCAILFELVGYDEMFISIYDSNRLMLDCVNTHLKRPDGIDAFQQALAVTITDGVVKVTVDGKTAFTYDYK